MLEAIYAAFAEGWTDAAGTDAARRDLTAEAIFLARLVAALLPDAPEALGLLALMLHAEARRPARRDAAGDYVPLGWQDPALWDAAMIAEAEALLSAPPPRRHRPLPARGRAAVGACPPLPQRPRRLAAGGAALRRAPRALRLAGGGDQPRPRAGRVDGAAAGLAALDAVAADPRLAEYQPYWAARAELLARAGAAAEARHAYAIAIGLERDPAVSRFLQQAQGALPER